MERVRDDAVGAEEQGGRVFPIHFGKAGGVYPSGGGKCGLLGISLAGKAIWSRNFGFLGVRYGLGAAGYGLGGELSSKATSFLPCGPQRVKQGVL